MQTSSTLNFQVQHQVANDHVKVIYSRPNNNREIYLWYPTCTERPHRDTCPTFAKLFSTGKS